MLWPLRFLVIFHYGGVDSVSKRHRSFLLASLLPAFLVVSAIAVLGAQEGRAQSATRPMKWSDPAAWPNRKVAPDLQYGVTFFNMFRDLTASGFYSSRIGMDDLEFIGNTFERANMHHGRKSCINLDRHISTLESNRVTYLIAINLQTDDGAEVPEFCGAKCALVPLGGLRRVLDGQHE